jgi:hypothetical protein
MAQARRRSVERRRAASVALSVSGHLLIVGGLFSAWRAPPEQPVPAPVTVALMEGLPLAKLPEVPTPSQPEPSEPPPPRAIARPTPTPAPPEVETLPVAEQAFTGDPAAEVSDGELAMASSAGTGAPAGACDMGGWLQRELRADPLVQAAVAEARSAGGMSRKAIRVWNGAWIRHGGQEGQGLAVIREAIRWEIAFAPEACRTQPMRGLVLISFNDAPGAGGVVMGQGQWRWGDLLGPRTAVWGATARN